MSDTSPSVPATAAPSPKRSRAVDPAMRAHRWAKDGRSREAQLYRAVVKQLRQHVGGKPSSAEALLIGRIAWMQTHMAHIDERAMKDGGLSPHATREYLAWSNSIGKLLRQLGLKGAAERPPSLAEHLARHAAEQGARLRAEAAQRAATGAGAGV